MSKIIEAKAVISAEDKTGAVFDKIAKKINGMTKVANTFAGIKPPQGGLMGMGAAGWGAKFQKDIDALRISSRELAGIQKNWENFHSAMGRNGPVRAANYFRAMDDWKNTTLSNLRRSAWAWRKPKRRIQALLSGRMYFVMSTHSHYSGCPEAIAAGHRILYCDAQ